MCLSEVASKLPVLGTLGLGLFDLIDADRSGKQVSK